MNKIELTFPVFYHCAIKGACALQQYNCVNVLLCGKPKADDSTSISESTASVYVNGAKPLPKDLIFDLLHLPSDEIIRRLKELNFFDVSAIADALERLLEMVSISTSAKEELLKVRQKPGQEYQFLCEVLCSSLKNPAAITRLTMEEKAIIKACRNNSQHFEQTSFSESAYGGPVDKGPGQNSNQHNDPAEESASSETPLENQLTDLLSVHKWTAKTPEDLSMIWNFCEAQFLFKNTLINVDHADIASVLPQNDFEFAIFLKFTGATNEIADYIERTEHFSGAISALIFIVGSEDLGIYECDGILKVFQSKCDPDANLVFGVDKDTSFPSGHMCTFIIASLLRNMEEQTEDHADSVEHPTEKSEEQDTEIDESDLFPLNLFK